MHDAIVASIASVLGDNNMFHHRSSASIMLVTALVSMGVGCAGQGRANLQGPASTKSQTLDPALIAARQRFKDAGYHHADADRYARISLGLKEETNLPLKRCVYYKVEAFYCDSLTRMSETYYVGALCIEAALPNCVLPICPAGEKAFYRTKTSATCDPPSTCVYLAVEGPFRTTDKLICDGLVDCSCWPGLACTMATCAPYDQSLDAPKDCPKCP